MTTVNHSERKCGEVSSAEKRQPFALKKPSLFYEVGPLERKAPKVSLPIDAPEFGMGSGEETSVTLAIRDLTV